VVGIHLLNDTVVLCQNSGAGVGGSLVFHTGSHDGLLGYHQRHCLALHVGAHQSTVTVIVLQEGDAGGRNRDHHSGRNVHIIDLIGIDFQDVIAAAGRNAGTDEVLGLIQRLVGLSNNVLILNVSGDILNFIGNDLIDQLAVFA